MVIQLVESFCHGERKKKWSVNHPQDECPSRVSIGMRISSVAVVYSGCIKWSNWCKKCAIERDGVKEAPPKWPPANGTSDTRVSPTRVRPKSFLPPPILGTDHCHHHRDGCRGAPTTAPHGPRRPTCARTPMDPLHAYPVNRRTSVSIRPRRYLRAHTTRTFVALPLTTTSERAQCNEGDRNQTKIATGPNDPTLEARSASDRTALD